MNIYSDAFWDAEADKLTDTSQVLKLPWEAENQVNINGRNGGFYYAENGRFLRKIGSSKNVYILITQNNAVEYRKLVDISHDTFLNIAATAYAESAYNSEAATAIVFCVFNHFRQLAGSSSTYPQYKTNYTGGNWTIKKTLIKMRNRLTDWQYAHDKSKVGGNNPGYRKFLKIEENEPINFAKTATIVNHNPQKVATIRGVIKAHLYYESGEGSDISKGGIGWHGLDIFTNKSIYPTWRKLLHIKDEHRILGFENYEPIYNVNDEQLMFISTGVFQGKTDFETSTSLENFTTLIYKSTPQLLKKDPKGGL